jgi:hypothetical protein
LLVGVIYEGRVQLLELLEFNEATLISEALLCKVLATFVSNEALALPSLFLFPVFKHFVVPLVASERSCERADSPTIIFGGRDIGVSTVVPEMIVTHHLDICVDCSV